MPAVRLLVEFVFTRHLAEIEPRTKIQPEGSIGIPPIVNRARGRFS